MTDFYYGLQVERSEGAHDDGDLITLTLRDGGRVLGVAREQRGVAGVTIVDGGNVYRPSGMFLSTDDALMAIKTYHDVRKMILEGGSRDS